MLRRAGLVNTSGHPITEVHAWPALTFYKLYLFCLYVCAHTHALVCVEVRGQLVWAGSLSTARDPRFHLRLLGLLSRRYIASFRLSWAPGNPATSPIPISLLRQKLRRLSRQVLTLLSFWSASWVAQGGTIYYAFKWGEGFYTFSSLI